MPGRSRGLRIVLCVGLLAAIGAGIAVWHRLGVHPQRIGEKPLIYARGMYLPSVTTGPWAPAWSPDGNRLVFAMHGSLWEVPATGGEAVQITSGTGYDSQPAWSPDSDRIVFTKVIDQRMDLWIVNADGSSPHPLTKNGGINVDPEWHSSNTIYFTSSVGRKGFGLSRISATGGNSVPALAHDQRAIEPSSSPDGEHIVFVSPGQGIWEQNVPDGKPRRLLQEETLWQARPKWSPDGHKIVYVSYRSGSNQLWLTDPNTGTPVQLTYLKDSEAFTPSWSPDSRFIAFVSNADHSFTLWTLPAVGGAPREVRITRLHYRYPVGTLDASVLDEKGKPTAARVYLEGSDGRSWAPEGVFQRCSNFTGDYYFQTEGGFSVEVPTGATTIEVVRGFEYYPAKQTVRIRQGSSIRVTLRLKRMTNLTARGWYSGDNHVHMNYGGSFRETPASLIGEMEAEDLNVVNALVANEQNHLVDMQYFIGRPDPHSTSNHILYFNEEYRPAFAGHLDLLNLKKLFFPFYDGTAGTPFAADFPSNAQVLDSVHSQGGVGGFAHPYEIAPGKDPSEAGYVGAREFPADAALGKVDFYDLMAVWTDKFVAAKVWYRLLNLGLRIPISAGSDVMANYWRGPTVGSVRVFVRTGPKLSYQRYIEALLEGHSFVTNGPLLSLTVNGREPGDQIDLPAGSTSILRIDADAQSIVPMAELDIIENGTAVYAQKAATPEYIHANTSLKVSGSAWIAARVTGPSKQHFLMDSYVYAHTNPVYVREAGISMRSPGDAEYFVRWMDGVLHLIDGRTFDKPEQKTEVREVYQKARARFEQLAAAR